MAEENNNVNINQMSTKQQEMASIFEKVDTYKDDIKNEGATDKAAPQQITWDKTFESFYGVKMTPNKSETPSIINLTNEVPNRFDNYRYRYLSGFLSDDTFKQQLESIMTAGMHANGKYIPLNEWQTFTREGDCIIAVKYLERVNTTSNEGTTGNSSDSNKTDNNSGIVEDKTIKNARDVLASKYAEEVLNKLNI